MSKPEEQPQETTSGDSDAEPKLTPLQRVKQQQELLRQNRSGGAQKPGSGGARGGSGGANRRAHMNRRSGGS